MTNIWIIYCDQIKQGTFCQRYSFFEFIIFNKRPSMRNFNEVSLFQSQNQKSFKRIQRPAVLSWELHCFLNQLIWKHLGTSIRVVLDCFFIIDISLVYFVYIGAFSACVSVHPIHACYPRKIEVGICSMGTSVDYSETSSACLKY